MSSTLMWKPDVPDDGSSLPDRLKFILEKKYRDYDEIKMTRSDMPYLEGLYDCGVEGSGELIDAIREYESIILWYSY